MIIVYGIKEQLNPIKSNLSTVIHQCMQDVLGLPEEKRAHRFIALEREDFYYPGGRTDAYTVIEINMMPDAKRKLTNNSLKHCSNKLRASFPSHQLILKSPLKNSPLIAGHFEV